MKAAYNSPKYKQLLFTLGEGRTLHKGGVLIVESRSVASARKQIGHDLFCSGFTLVNVNLASIVSPYIGETEKNISAVFDKAGKSDFLLFFDEADALFGRRTRKTSNDEQVDPDILIQFALDAKAYAAFIVPRLTIFSRKKLSSAEAVILFTRGAGSSAS